MQARIKPVAFAVLLGLLGGCKFGHESAAEHIEKAKGYEAKQDYHASVIELKAALQQEPKNAEARWLLGLDYLKLKQGGGAEIQLEKALQLGISPQSARIPLAQAWLLKGDFGKVLDKLTPGDRDDPQTLAQILQMRGDAYMGQGKYAQACPLYDQSVKDDAGYVPAYWGQARCEYGNGHPDQALATAQKAARMDPKRLESWYLLGDLYRARNQPEQAMAAYDQALKVQPDDVQARAYKAIMLLSMDRLADAQKLIDGLRKSDPKVVITKYLSAYVAYRQGRYNDAADLLQEVLRADPDYVPAQMLYGVVNYSAKHDEIALDSFSKVLAATDMPQARLFLAATELRLGSNDAALKTLAPLLEESSVNAKTLLLAGQAAMNLGDYARAMDYLARAGKAAPGDTAVRTSLAQAQLLTGDSQGISGLESVIADNPQDTQAYLLLASAQLAKADYAAALATLGKMSTAQPKNPVPYLLQGRVYLLQNNPAAARRAFDRSQAADPDFLPAAGALAELDVQQKQPAQARQRFLAILARKPGNLGAQLGLARVDLALGDRKAYVGDMEAAIKGNPQAPQPVVLLTQYYISVRQPGLALQAARKAAQAHPGNPAFLDNLGQALLAAGRKNDAVDTYTNLTNLQSRSPVAWYRLAWAQRVAGDMNGAQQSLQKAIGLAPKYLDAQVAMAGLYMAMGRADSALNEARQIQQAFPKSRSGYDLEAELQMRLKRPDLALQALAAAYQKIPSSETAASYHLALLQQGKTAQAEQLAQQWLKAHANDADFRMYLAGTYLAQHQDALATAQYKEVLALAPDNVLALNNLAALLQRQNDPAAFGYAERAYKLQPDNPLVADTYGWGLVLEDKVQQAYPILQAAVKGAGQMPAVQYHHAVAAYKLGQMAAAQAGLRAALASKESFSERDQAAALLRKIR